MCKAEFMWTCQRNKQQCIHKSLVCDGYEQCDDGSDEDSGLCASCPRKFGFPDGKSHLATFLCQHRFTNRSICAVPCDGNDDLCLDSTDEICVDQVCICYN